MHQDLPPQKQQKDMEIRHSRKKQNIASMGLVYHHSIHVWYIFTYIWLICMVNVGKYTIHGWYGYIYLHEWLMFTV